jgi:hypothetical protein
VFDLREQNFYTRNESNLTQNVYKKQRIELGNDQRNLSDLQNLSKTIDSLKSVLPQLTHSRIQVCLASIKHHLLKGDNNSAFQILVTLISTLRSTFPQFSQQFDASIRNPLPFAVIDSLLRNFTNGIYSTTNPHILNLVNPNLVPNTHTIHHPNHSHNNKNNNNNNNNNKNTVEYQHACILTITQPSLKYVELSDIPWMEKRIENYDPFYEPLGMFAQFKIITKE